MRRSRHLAWAVVCLSAMACSGPGSVGVSASCAAPYVETEPMRAQPGAPVTVRGDGHLDGCDDTGESAPAEPLDDLPVLFQQGGALTDLGRLDASGPEGSVRTTITVPVDAQPGLASVTVGASQPALVMVGDGRGGYPPTPGQPTGPFDLTVDLQAVPSSPEGGWVLASATTVDAQVQDAEAHVTAVAPLGAAQLSLGRPPPASWAVDVQVHRCVRLGCSPSAPAAAPTARATEVRLLDGPARMTCLHDGAGGCDLRGTG